MDTKSSAEMARLRDGLSRRVDAIIDQAVATQRLVGAVVLIAHDGETIYSRSRGFADREAQRHMDEDTIFRLSSLTKPIVAAAAMVLVENGRIDLDDVITQWLPEFRPKTPNGVEAVITVRNLLTHTAGFTYVCKSGGQPECRDHYVHDSFRESCMPSLDESL